jgi:hypothetical protein
MIAIIGVIMGAGIGERVFGVTGAACSVMNVHCEYVYGAFPGEEGKSGYVRYNYNAYLRLLKFRSAAYARVFGRTFDEGDGVGIFIE